MQRHALPGRSRGPPGRAEWGSMDRYTPIIPPLAMESGRPLDSAIAAADRALRSVFAPARSTRPAPGAPGNTPELPDAERAPARLA